MQKLTRRGFASARPGVFRPPWSSEQTVRNACTSCGDCIAACPEGILVRGPANTPTVDFTRGECTFCKACAEACREDVFSPTDTKPWALIAHLESACLLSSGVSCRLCTDICDTEALRFDLRAGPVGRVHVAQDACTGCGACVSACPVSAIKMTPSLLPTTEPAE